MSGDIFFLFTKNLIRMRTILFNYYIIILKTFEKCRLDVPLMGKLLM